MDFFGVKCVWDWGVGAGFMFMWVLVFVLQGTTLQWVGFFKELEFNSPARYLISNL
jgi:hypothetical protein